jgi:hypothetical protein
MRSRITGQLNNCETLRALRRRLAKAAMRQQESRRPHGYDISSTAWVVSSAS